MGAKLELGKADEFPLAIENRRQWPRKASELTEVTVVHGSNSQMAAVIDESLGGIGIKMAEVFNIVRGDHLKLLYRGIPVLGIVRRVQTEANGHCVGLEWLNTRRNEAWTRAKNHRKSLAHYLSFSGFCVACRVDDRMVDDCVQATLPDGTTCKVKSADLLVRTVGERKAELEQLSLDLTMLAGVYQLGEHPSKSARIEAILDFEFEHRTRTGSDVAEQIRAQNKKILDQSQRIEELESYLACITTLTARIKELELEMDGT